MRADHDNLEAIAAASVIRPAPSRSGSTGAQWRGGRCRRGGWTAVAVLLLAGWASCHREPPKPREQRLVSLTPSATEVIAAIGLIGRLVGVDDYSQYPESVKSLPKIGSFLAPSLEAIVALKPSHVIADDVHADTARALRDAGVATVVFPMHSLSDVRAALRHLGEELGRGAEAARALQEIDDAIEAARQAKLVPAPRVLVVIDRAAGGLGDLVCAANGSWMDQLLAIVGANNVLAASGVRYPKVSLEDVIKADPEVILDLSFNADAATAWKRIDVTATRKGRVIARTDAFLIGPSPRVAQALRVLQEALRAP
jgi:iron complex transport system substrate-binding protein